MTWLRRLRERRGANRDLSTLWGQVHDLSDYLKAVKAELEATRTERDAWQSVALDAFQVSTAQDRPGGLEAVRPI